MTAFIDRAALMREAWRRYRDGQRLGLGWDFARCLRMSWTAAKLREQFPRQSYQPDERPQRVALLSGIITAMHGKTLERLAR